MIRFAAIFLLCLPLLSGCAKQPVFDPPADGISRFPTGEALEEGDVILGRSYGLIGAMFAIQSQAGGKYSHGAMIYRADDGRLMVLNYRPTGMETCTPEEFFSRYNRLALVRYGGDFDAASAPAEAGGAGLRGKAALSAAARHWLGKNADTRIPPDYRLDHDEHSAMFCLELTSTVYRECGLPDPFYKARLANEDPMLRTANAWFKTDVVEIRSPSSALDNPAFRPVSEWVRPEYDMREEALNEELMRVMVEDVENGYRPRKPDFGERMKIRQIFALYHIVTNAMFWRPKQDLPDFIDTEVIANGFMLYSYMKKSKAEARRHIYPETLPVFIIDEDREITLDKVRQMVREATATCRDVYLTLN